MRCRAIGGGEKGVRVDDGGRPDDEETFVGVDVPDAEGFVAGAGDDFVSVDVRLLRRIWNREDLLIKLNTVDTIGVSVKVDG